MQGAETWRELLAEMTRDPQERDRIVRELNVSPVTITRWLNDESTPRLDNVRHLLDVVPEQQRKRLFDLLIRDFPDITLHVEDDEPLHEVAADFYAHVFTTYVTIPANMRFWTLSKMILQYLLEGLDRELQHVAILLLRCQPSPKHIIRSLHSVMGVGTPPWSGNLETQTILLGAESFVGQVFLSGHADLIENTENYSGLQSISEYSSPGAQLHPFSTGIEQYVQIRRIASEMAAPVVHRDSRAGILYACSTRPGAFQRSHLQLLRACAVLMTLAFAPDDFYPLQDIILHMLPHPWLQGPLLLQVPQRVLQLMREKMNNQVPLDRPGAERIVWQQIEEELIQLATSKL